MPKAVKKSPTEAAKELVGAPETLGAVTEQKAVEDIHVDSAEVIKTEQDTAGETVQEPSTESTLDPSADATPTDLPVWIEGDPEPTTETTSEEPSQAGEVTDVANEDAAVLEGPGIDIPVSAEVIQDAIDNPDHIGHTNDTQDAILEEVDQQKVFDGHIAKPSKKEEEEEEEGQGTKDEQETTDVESADPSAKYKFSEEKLDAYLSSEKPQLKIQQLNRGGNFVSTDDHEIYVPLSLFK